MTILINGLPAAIKKGSSFEFISENSFFTGADAYTLSITFPLAGCPENLKIFGHLNRKDCNLDRLLLNCEIHEGAFNVYGAVNIVSINEKEVKTQFLEGRSVSNFKTDLDDVYINELDLGSTHKVMSSNKYISEHVRKYRDQVESGDYTGYVFLPWVNNTTGNMQNPLVDMGFPEYFAYKYAGGEHDYYPEVVGQPYLLHVIRRVMDEIGYRFDDSNFEGTWWENIIVCNSLPLAWEMPEMRYILPHWTVPEFMEQVERFMDAQFVMDAATMTCKIVLNGSTMNNMPEIELKNVIDVHQVDLKDADDVKDTFYDQINLAYADCNHQLWPYYSCDGALQKMSVERWTNIARMKATLDALLVCTGKMKHKYYQCIHYCAAEDTYFILKCEHVQKTSNTVTHYMRYVVVNEFGARILTKGDNAETKEIAIVPVCIDSVDKGSVFFMECGTLGDDTGSQEANPDQTFAANAIKAGEGSTRDEYFDRLYVGFWEGTPTTYYPDLPHPYVNKYEVLPNNTMQTNRYNMRLSGIKAPGGKVRKFLVDQSKKFSFTFIADAIPNVQSYFFIHGKKYLAEKITATFSESGMSQKMKMVAYRVEELPH